MKIHWLVAGLVVAGLSTTALASGHHHKHATKPTANPTKFHPVDIKLVADDSTSQDDSQNQAGSDNSNASGDDNGATDNSQQDTNSDQDTQSDTDQGSGDDD